MKTLKYHTTLANYFQSKPLYLDGEEYDKPNSRKLVELPWQQTKAVSFDILETLNDYSFIEAKLLNNMEYLLLEDYDIAVYKDDEKDYNYKFLLSNLTTLTKYPKQLLNLLYFHGNKKRKAKVMDTFNKRINNGYLFTTEKQNYTIFDDEKKDESFNFQINYSKEIITSKNTVCSKKGFLFCIKQIGVLTAVNLNNGEEHAVWIEIPDDVPEAINVSSDGKYIVFAYNNQILTIYKLDYQFTKNQFIIKGTKHHIEFEYLLPEVDAPAFYFIEDNLIFQNIDGDILSANLKNEEIKTLIASTVLNDNSEFASINFCSEYTAIGVHHFNTSSLYLLSDNQVLSTYSFDDIIQSSDTINDYELVVYTLDKKLHHLKVINNKVENILVLDLIESPVCSTNDGKSVIVFLQPNHLFRYDNYKGLIPVENMPTSMGIVNELVYLREQSFLILSNTYFANFTLSIGSNHNPYEVNTILQDQKGSHKVLFKVDREEVLIDIDNNNIKKFDIVKSTYRNENLISIDGSGNILHLYFEGKGEYYESSDKKWQILENIPISPLSIIGDSNSGFWVNSKEGDIYYYHKNHGWKKTYKIEEEIVGCGALRIINNVLIWNGVVLKSGEFGTDFKCQVRFFKIEKNSANPLISQIGERIFATHNGFIDSIHFNDISKKFYMFLFSDKEPFQKARIGTIDEFINATEKIKDIIGLDQSVKYLHSSGTKNLLFAFGNNGCLFLIDIEKFIVKSYLSPNLGFTKSVQSYRVQQPFISSISNSYIYKISICNNGG
jgi:hypothetical protein